MNADTSSGVERFDAVVIGAGVSGLYQLYRLRELGLEVRVYERGGGVGGTWYWNRYPGARFDSESYSYAYSFSDELLEEWEWSEHFAAQPETLRYLEFVADKFELRRDIRFDMTMTGAHWQEAAREWEIFFADGSRVYARFLITAIGGFATPTLPAIEGRDSYAGEAYHTAQWPHRPVDFAGKRVAVIGTGATGVQVIQEVAKTAATLSVFQRQPNWCAPLLNRPITPEEQRRIKAGYKQIFALCNETFAGFMHQSDRRNAVEVSAEEREALFEKLYGEPGFGIWMANFRDVMIDARANALLSDFIARKIRSRVNDPAIAEKLIPTNHGFGTRRVPLETNYYEVYNQPNVRLVDLRETPILRMAPSGIVTTAGAFDFDLIVFATGFDAVTGGYSRLDLRGAGGRRLVDKWAEGPRTFLGLLHEGFPNLVTLVGPHNAATFCNMPRCIEQNVEWVTRLLARLRAQGRTRIEPTPAAEDEWTAHVLDGAARMLLTKVDSWFNGVNRNVAGRDVRRFQLYANGLPTYRRRCEEVAAQDYAGTVIA
ncbi:MAG TPA: NAD(P)/FAD-dependent oxidoreductase [Gammaproteobacteria bacterium]|nr:NAD(P)/FAD-dependent oxidoreductase [Gammaproteobacteria bacterium]